MTDPADLKTTGAGKYPAQPKVTPTGAASRPPAKANQAGGGTSFAETLEQAQDLKFSNHAQKRLEKRNIAISDDGLARLAQAVDKAEKRGGRESLVLMDDMAFIVNIRERLVVTALDATSRKDGVFTQIDSVVFAGSDDESETAASSTPKTDTTTEPKASK